MRLYRPSLLALLAVVACKDGDSVVTDTDTGPSVIGESGIFTDSGGADSDSQDSGGDSGGDDTNADDTGEVVSDATVLSVDASTGLVTALAEGSAFITADAEGLHAEALVAVQADGALSITVVDGLTGAPIPSARLSYGETRVTADADGHATLTVALGAPADISVWVDSGGYIPLSVMGAASQSRIP